MNILKKLFDHEYKELKRFTKIADQVMDLEEEYVKKYGSLEVKESGSDFDWINNNWPWDNGGVDYV